MKKLIRITTVPISLDKLLSGQLKFMSAYYKVVAVSSDKTLLNKVGEKEEVEVYEVNMTRKITPLKDLVAVAKLYRFLKREKPFIVHTHTPKAGTVGMLAAMLAGVKIRLHTVAGLPLLEAKGIKRHLLNNVERFTYRCATKVYPNSIGLKNIIVSQGFCKEKKIKVLGNGSSNGIDVEYFSPDSISNSDCQELRDKLNISIQSFVYVFVGRLVGDKGINELVKAFKMLSAQQYNINLLLVGPLEDDLDPLEEETRKEITANNKIITVGYQADVRPYFAISNVLVFPSYREGFPNVVMQAGAMGLPGIVTNINGCNEIIEHGNNGLIIPVKDIQSLLEAMASVYIKKDMMREMESFARDMIVSRFSQREIWNAILREYKSFEDV